MKMKIGDTRSAVRIRVAILSVWICWFATEVQGQSPLARSVSAAVSDVGMALDLPQQGPRVIALVQALDRVPADELGPFISDIQSQLAEHEHSQDLALVLLPRWVSTDPVAAMEATLALSNRAWRESRLRQIVQLWAADDVDAVLRRGEQITDPALRSLFVRVTAPVIAEQRPRAALDLLEAVNLGFNYANWTRRSVLTAWAKHDPEGAAAEVHRMKAGRAKHDATIAVVHRWKEIAPRAAYEWLSTQPGNSALLRESEQIFAEWCSVDLPGAIEHLTDRSVPKGLRHQLGRAYAEQRPHRVLPWVREVKPLVVQQQLAGGAVNYLSTNTPTLAAKLVPFLSPAVNRQYLQAIVRSWAAYDFDAARDWVNEIKVDRDRIYAATGLFGHLHNQSFDASVEFIASLKDENVRKNLVSIFVSKWAAKEPEKTAGWIADVSGPQEREGLMRLMIPLIANESPALAAGMLDRHSNDALLKQSADAIVRSWARVDLTAALKWLEQKPPGILSASAWESLIRQVPYEERGLAERMVRRIADQKVRRTTGIAWLRRVKEVDPIAAFALLENSRLGEGLNYRDSSVMRAALERDVPKTLDMIVRLSSRESREYYAQRAAEFLATADPSMAIEWIGGLEVKDYNRGIMYQTVMRGWAAREPQKALETAMAIPLAMNRDRAALAALPSWIEADLAGAVRFVKELKDVGMRAKLMSPLAVAMGKTDPGKGIEVAMQLPDPDRLNSLKSLFANWLDRDEEAAVKWLGNLKDATFKVSVINSVSYQLSRKAPRLLVQIAQDLPSGSTRRSAVERGIAEWAGQDPTAALGAVKAMAESTLRRNAFATVLRAAIRKGQVDIAGMLAEVDEGALRFEVVKSILREWTAKNSGAAVDWVLKNLSPEQHGELTDTFRYSGSNGNYESIAKFAATLPLTKFRGMVHSLLSGWLRADRTKAVAWIRSIEADENREYALDSASRSLARSNIDLATELAMGLKDESRRRMIFNSLGSGAASNPDLGLAWLESLPTGPLHSNAVSGVMYTMGGSQPHRALAYLTKLTDPNLRSNATVRVVVGWSNREAESAVRGVLKMPKDALQQACLKVAIRSWSGREPRLSSDFLKGLDAEIRTPELVWAFIDAVDGYNAGIAAEWVLKIGITEDKKARAVGVALMLLRKDKAAGKAFIDKLPADVATSARSKAKSYRLL